MSVLDLFRLDGKVAAVFRAGRASDYIAGQTIFLDGGLSAE
jgi:hypothetical protein